MVNGVCVEEGTGQVGNWQDRTGGDEAPSNTEGTREQGEWHQSPERIFSSRKAES